MVLCSLSASGVAGFLTAALFVLRRYILLFCGWAAANPDELLAGIAAVRRMLDRTQPPRPPQPPDPGALAPKE